MRAWTHAGLWVAAPLAPAARRTEAHARAGAVGWRWGQWSTMLWLVGVATRLCMAQGVFIRWRTISFRSHFLDFQERRNGKELEYSHTVSVLY